MKKTNHNLFITNHRKKESEISENEFYSTHENSVKCFLDNFSMKKNCVCWEPAAGLGNIAEVLKEYGHTVITSDLINRKYCDFHGDFLLQPHASIISQKYLNDKHINYIITNPPFKLAEQFIRHAHKISLQHEYIIMYLKLTFLEGKARYKLFQELPPKEIWIHSSRQGCSSTGAKEFANGGSVCFAWYVWQKDKKSDTIIKWLPPN